MVSTNSYLDIGDRTLEYFFLVDSNLAVKKQFPVTDNFDYSKTHGLIGFNDETYAFINKYNSYNGTDSGVYGLYQLHDDAFEPIFELKYPPSWIQVGGAVNDLVDGSIHNLVNIPIVENEEIKMHTLHLKFNPDNNTVDTSLNYLNNGNEVLPLSVGYLSDSIFSIKKLDKEPKYYNIHQNSIHNYSYSEGFRNQPRSFPKKNPFNPTNEIWYSIANSKNVKSNGTIANGEEHLPTNPWLYKFNSRFELIDRIRFLDELNEFPSTYFEKLIFGINYKGFDFSAKNEIIFATSSFPIEENDGNGSDWAFNKHFDTKLHFFKVDTLGKVICQNSFFEGDQNNHFPFHVFGTNSGGAILINTVAGLDSITNLAPDVSYANVEMIKVDRHCKITNVNNLSRTLGLTVFPNPTKSKLFIKGGTLQNCNLSIFDPSGKLEISGDYSSSGFSLETLEKGLHFILLQKDGQIIYEGTVIKE